MTTSSAQMVLQLGPRRWLMLVVVLCAALVVVLDGFIVNVAFARLRHLGAGDHAAQSWSLALRAAFGWAASTHNRK